MGTLALMVLRSKTFWLSILACLVLYMAYSWVYDRGVASRDTEVAQLKYDLNVAKNLVTEAKENARVQKVAYDAAVVALRLDHQITLAELKTKLDATQAREKRLKENLNAVTKIYVSPKADAGCTVNAGFVRLHDLSAKGLDPTIAAEASGVPGSGSEAADSPSTVKLSEVGYTVANNYGECQSRLEVIEGWQLWYTKSLEAWRKAVALQASYPTIVVETPK